MRTQVETVEVMQRALEPFIAEYLRHRMVFVAGLTIAALGVVPSIAHADRRPTLATDAFYVGVRIDPGIAMTAAWDVDVYLLRNRTLSLGPGVSISVLGSPATNGRQQDFLLSVDVLRVKFGASSASGEWRPFVMAGGGFSFVRMPAQMVADVGVDVRGTNGTMRVTGTQTFPALDEFAPMVTIGAGLDFFSNGPLGATALLVAHFHPNGTSRMPDAWIEFALGVRFGL